MREIGDGDDERGTDLPRPQIGTFEWMDINIYYGFYRHEDTTERNEGMNGVIFARIHDS